jgi:Universal stress protein family
MGSVSEYVVNHATCPVTVVKSSEHDEIDITYMYYIMPFALHVCSNVPT